MDGNKGTGEMKFHLPTCPHHVGISWRTQRRLTRIQTLPSVLAAADLPKFPPCSPSAAARSDRGARSKH